MDEWTFLNPDISKEVGDKHVDRNHHDGPPSYGYYIRRVILFSPARLSAPIFFFYSLALRLESNPGLLMSYSFPCPSTRHNLIYGRYVVLEQPRRMPESKTGGSVCVHLKLFPPPRNSVSCFLSCISASIKSACRISCPQSLSLASRRSSRLR